ncbi:hypothetical protein Z517_09610 [Fonsecaea pedrosoi CBS 271.37]|uniref:Cytochrome P450 monooxygenase n=1 Tax=Fonsecaea pedrosoi CBS 271.37 TaxID=1442368 RepID=A0A0D2GXR0_9EURO|nr:uncharacterized protein Z517_09610 [Fonsecaea pedrosoi CBS 271.37]KIW77164.1 hypothetical protein Z517_09610 [Fonsecaea pedrosoi CBS 271.37]
MAVLAFLPSSLSTGQRVGVLGAASIVCYVLYCLVAGVYHLYFSPVRKFPGPKLWVVFPILRWTALLQGTLERHLLDFHIKYGNVVRIGPSELSFNDAQAWQDIYGFGHPELPKAVAFHEPDGKPDHLIHANSADHTRYRKIMAGGFSEKAIRKQEPLIKVYVDSLMEQLRILGRQGDRVDLAKWLHLVTFDLIGDLSFGEPFGGVSSAQEHDYIRTMFLFVKAGAYLSFFYNYPILGKLASFLTPKSLAEAHSRQWQFSEQVTMRRIRNKGQQGRGDFMDSMVESRGTPNGMSDQEILVNASVLISAGAETSATTLSGTLYYLLRHPDKLAHAQHEVRSVFSDESEITFITSSSKLPYMVACITEAMRIYPPLPSTLPRFTPPGAPTMISGHVVPPNVIVGVNQLAAYWDPRNFYAADKYLPERWLRDHYSQANSPFHYDKRDALQPFSVGPRNCIGRNLAYAETRTIMARLLYNFDFELCEESRDWADQKIVFWWDKKPMLCVIRNRDSQELWKREA